LSESIGMTASECHHRPAPGRRRLLLPIFIMGQQIDRWEGALLFGYYIAYALYLILDATEHEALSAFSTVILEFALP
jgi:hypothetical protein